MQIGPSVSFMWVATVWVLRTLLFSAVSLFLALLGIRLLDALTPSIHDREMIGKDPLAVGIFISGFFIFLGLVIHGASIAPIAIGGSLSAGVVDSTRLSLIALGFVVSLFLGLGVFWALDRLTPKIPFHSIRESPRGVGVFVFGYLVFFGLIIHAALSSPL